MSTTLNAARLLTWLLVSMAAISVLVAGVGILNIMLANVADRRLEIGVKLAVGANPLTVGLEFLVEAIVLAVIGATAGFALAELAAFGFRALDYPAHVPVFSMLLSAGLALAVGVAAGWFPAFRAAHLDPKEVLRDAK
jgi:putative ABC transport system permease protein